MEHRRIIGHITKSLEAEPGITALFLGGSHGHGTSDRFSDIDFIALAEPEHHAALAASWRAALESLASVVFWTERQGGGAFLANAILADWTRCDLYQLPRSAFGGRAQNTTRPLIDPDGFWQSLPAELPPGRPDPTRIHHIIHEFIRVLGLLAVGAGRGEYVLLVRGAGILRDLLTDLMIEECPVADRGGALHPSRLISAADMSELAALPYPGPVRDDLIAAHIAIARAFLPRARRIARQIDLEWPEAFESATREHLHKELDIHIG